MANSRMAGDELDKEDPVAEEAKEAVVDASQNKSLSDRFGQDYVDRAKDDGLQDATSNGGYSRKELASEFRYGRGDLSVDEMTSKFQGMVDSGDFKGNNKAQDFLKMHGVNFGGGEDPVQETTPSPEPTPGPDLITQPAPEEEKPDIYLPGPGGPGGPQNINQDNDINTNINGNDNEVTNSVDNSIRQYRGASGNSQIGATDLMDNYVLNLRKSRQAG